jgi:hypothetical protein
MVKFYADNHQKHHIGAVDLDNEKVIGVWVFLKEVV